MHGVSETFADLFPYVFPQSDDITWRSHLHDLAVVGHTVESGVNQKATFAEQRLDVERHLHVGGIHTFVLQDDCVEFQKF